MLTKRSTQVPQISINNSINYYHQRPGKLLNTDWLRQDFFINQGHF